MPLVRLARVTAALLLVALSVLARPGAASAADPPKVVVIVGPAREATDRYRADGADAARVARRFTPNVVTVFAPDATWPAVRSALQGASLVVYMGHGNGWPSRYRDALFPPTQNGFGLNPVAGGSDEVHQYFGEAWLGRDIRLAAGAVVVLSHLCYASGNSEPELPEGTLADARQRVDNYAAGFLRAGAGAVIADAFLRPSWYVGAVLGGNTADAAWRSAPDRHGHLVAFDSVRTPGASAILDPTFATHGFYRSIVTSGAAMSTVAAGVTDTPVDPSAVAPSRARSGVVFGPPTVGDAVAGGMVGVSIPFTVQPGGTMPDGMDLGVHWDAAAGATSTTAAPVLSGSAKAGAVDPQPVTIEDGYLLATVSAPAAPGPYRLTILLADDTGVAFDAATQALVPAISVEIAPAAARPHLPPGREPR